VEAGLHYRDESSSIQRVIQICRDIGYQQGIPERVHIYESQVMGRRDEEIGGRLEVGEGVSRQQSNKGWWSVRVIGASRVSGDHQNEEEKGRKREYYCRNAPSVDNPWLIAPWVN